METKAETQKSTKEVGSSRSVAVPRSRKALFISMGVLALLGLLLLAWRWWTYASAHESTDDAYVVAHIHTVSTRVAGTVMSVAVEENTQVAKGAVLVRLDPADYQVRVEQARAALRVAQQQAAAAAAGIPEAAARAAATAQQATGGVGGAQSQIAQAQSGVAEAQAGVMAARAVVAQADANLLRAKQDEQRYRMLVREGAVSQQQYDQALANLNVAKAQREASADQLRAQQTRVQAAQHAVAQAQSNLVGQRGQFSAAQASRIAVEAARAQYGTANAIIEQAAAQLHEAELALSYCTIYAPVSGVTGRRQAEVGQRVQPGQALFSIVERAPWINANFKETQLGRMRKGQPVDIEIDTFPHHTFRGYVESISPASGAQFALLPPENATGNFTKIVQRVPVRIVFDKNSIKGYESRIVAGMSTIVHVAVR